MYIRKDIHKSLRLDAKMAEGAKCFAWAKLFRECDWLLRKKDRENQRLRAALDRIAYGKYHWEADAQEEARAALEGK